MSWKFWHLVVSLGRTDTECSLLDSDTDIESFMDGYMLIDLLVNDIKL
jgi:hypothetical protein